MNGLKDDAAIAWIDFQNSDAVKQLRKYQQERRRRFWLNTIGSIVGACAVLWMCSCTIAPTVTEAKQPSSWARTNVISYDSKGLIVRADWIRVYHGMLKVYGNKLPISEQVPAEDMTGITPQLQDFHVSWETNARFADLKRIEKESPP